MVLIYPNPGISLLSCPADSASRPFCWAVWMMRCVWWQLPEARAAMVGLPCEKNHLGNKHGELEHDPFSFDDFPIKNGAFPTFLPSGKQTWILKTTHLQIPPY